MPCSLVIPDGLPLTECHKNYLTKEFGLRVLKICLSCQERVVSLKKPKKGRAIEL